MCTPNWIMYYNCRFSWWLRQLRICLQYWRPGFDPWVGKIPWRRECPPIPAFFPGEFHRWRSLARHSPYCQCFIWIIIVLYYWVAQKACLNFSVSCYGKNKWTFWPTQCIKILIQFKNHVHVETNYYSILLGYSESIIWITSYGKIQMNFLATQYIKILFQFKDHIHAEKSPG